MKTEVTLLDGAQPFEGDKQLTLRSLPADAQIISSTARVRPVPPLPHVEVVSLVGASPFAWGVTRKGSTVDFHARRVVDTIDVLGITDADTVNLQIDVGGTWITLNNDGTMDVPDDEKDEEFAVNGGVVDLRQIVTSRLQITEPANTPVTEVTWLSTPQNASLRIGGQGPFWFETGELLAEATTPEFSEFLQAYLMEAAVENGYYVVPFTLHVDTIARLEVIVEIEYTREVAVLPQEVPQVVLPFSHDSAPAADAELLTVTLPQGARVLPGATSVRVSGTFEPSRIVLGPTTPVEAEAVVLVSGGLSQAQPIMVDEDVAATAVDLYVEALSSSAELSITVVGDADGKPFGEPLLAEPATLRLEQEVEQGLHWFSATLPAEFQFWARGRDGRPRRYWLVVSSAAGEVNWGVLPQMTMGGMMGVQASSDAGLSWQTARVPLLPGAVGSLFRLRHTPAQFEVPVQLQVGEGEAAQLVSLDRFRPLGRTEFTVDFPEFADAINDYIAQAGGAAACPQGEQLKNGDFARWTMVGDRIGAPQPVDDIPGIATVTIAPNGEWAYMGLPEGGASFLSLPDHRLLAAGLPAPSSRQYVVVRHDSKRIYVADPEQVYVIDAESQQPIGDSTLLVTALATCLALSLDGRFLYIGGMGGSPEHGQVQVIDTAVLEGLLNSGAEFNISDAMVSGDPTIFPSPIPLQDNAVPTSLAISPDGRRLFVTAILGTTMPMGQVYIFDTSTHQPLIEAPLIVGASPRDVAITPDGRWALIVNEGENTVSVVDTTRLLPLQPIALPKPPNSSLEPVAVEVSPDGRRVFVANQANHSISVIELATWQVGNPIVVGQQVGGLIDIMVTPAGDRLYVTLEDPYDTSGLFFLPLGRQFPDEWTLTQGFVWPVPFGDPYHLTARLGPLTQDEQDARPARPSALSQVVAAGGGCTYDFSFWGIAENDGATAEIIWRGAACAPQRIDRVPIQIAEQQPRAVSLPDLLLHRVRLPAPPGATQAEIRFLVPSQKYAIVDTVSFQATTEAVANGDLLHENEDGEVSGWQVVPATAVGFTMLPDEAGTRLANMGSQPVALVQSFPVTAGQPFILLFRGEMVNQLSAREPVRLELHWLDAQDAPTGTITSLTIQSGETERRLQDTIPANVAGAELHLVIPASTTLTVRQISFVPVELVTVPIQFLAQAPGDLTVTGFQVAYEVSETTAAPLPAEGLCPPTPPGRRPDGRPGHGCPWCPSPCGTCEEEPAAENGPAVPAPGPMRALAPPRRTTRPLQVTRAQAELTVATAPPPIRPVEAVTAALMLATPAEWSVRAPELAAASLPLAVISGIGVERASALTGLAIDSIPRLATAEPETIAAVLRGVSPTMARTFVTEAQTLVTSPETLPAPLVSCIMPTYNRRHFVPKAIELFQRQDYPNRELIILDDGDDPVEDLMPDDDMIRYVRLAVRQTIGQKRNVGCQEARGPIIAHWDDDVWVASWRLSYQVAALIEYEADLCGLDNLLRYNLLTAQAWHSVRPPGREPWMPGNTFCYRKSFWQERPFGDRPVGSDIVFLRQRPGARIIALQAITWLVDIIHGQNISPKDSRSPLWHAYPATDIQRLLGDDWAFYVQLAQESLAGTDGR